MFTTGAAIPSLPGSSRRTLEMASQQVICGDCPDWAIDITKREYSQQQAHHGVTVSPQPVEIALRSGLPHEQHDGRAAVQRRNRQQIERAKKQVERKERDRKSVV